MNILYLLNSGMPGGMEQHVLDLVRGIAARKHNVFVWCLDGEIGLWYEKAGAAVYQKYIKHDLDPKYIKDLIDFIKNNSIDVVHAHELKSSANAMIACKIAGVKSVITNIHTPMSEWRVKSFIKKILTKINTFFYAIEVTLLSDTEIALTESRKKVKIKEGIAPNKIVIIPNALDTQKYNLNEKDLNFYKSEFRRKYNIPYNSCIFGTVGRLTEEKGHEIAVRGFAEYIKNNRDMPAWLLIAGGGRLEPDIIKLAKDLGISEKVIITGVFKQEELSKHYACIDIFIFPSLAEGFGLVLAEAMYFSLPILSSDLPVLKEVAGETANYFKAGNYKDLAEKMDQAIKSDLLHKKNYSGNARILDLYTMDKFISSYEGLYKHFLNKNS